MNLKLISSFMPPKIDIGIGHTWWATMNSQKIPFFILWSARLPVSKILI
jgi:hypothetical protein